MRMFAELPAKDVISSSYVESSHLMAKVVGGTLDDVGYARDG